MIQGFKQRCAILPGLTGSENTQVFIHGIELTIAKFEMLAECLHGALAMFLEVSGIEPESAVRTMQKLYMLLVTLDLPE